MTQGKRVRDNNYPENSGEYSKITTDKGTFWFAIVPGGDQPGNLRNYDIIVNPDETITVCQRICYTSFDKKVIWNGFLIKGCWHEG